jgi:opacity protein-like surface antigen
VTAALDETIGGRAPSDSLVPPATGIVPAPALLLALAVLGFAPGAVRAQGFGVDVEAGYRTLNASDSAQAIFGSTGGLTFGGSLQYALESGLFFRGGYRYFAKDGERVFLADASSTPAPLGHPLEATIGSIDAIVGWRFRLGGKKPSPLTPYLGFGAEFASYEEESTVGGLVERSDATKVGGQVVLGLEYAAFGRWTLTAEAGYSMVPNAVGVGGVSEIYGEDDIGGFRIMGRIGYRFGGGATRPPAKTK